MKHLKNFNEGLIGRSDDDFDTNEDYLKDDVVDALQTFDVIMGIMNGDHPTINKGDEKFEEFLKYALENYHNEYSPKNIKKLINKL